MATKTKRKPKTKPKKARINPGELNRMVQKVAHLDRAVGKISASVDSLEKQLRLLTIAIVLVVAAIAYVNHIKADVPADRPAIAKRR